MLINELAQQTAFSIDTIRFYEKTGLLDEKSVIRRPNKYRDYAEIHVKRLLVIRDLKDLGFTLKEIQETISLYEKEPLNCVQNIPKIDKKLSLLSLTIERLTRVRETLTDTRNDCKTDCKNCCGLNKTLQTLRR